MRTAISALLVFACLLGLHSQENTYLISSGKFDASPTTISFSPDGKLLLLGFSDGSIRVLDPETLETTLEKKEAHQKAVTALDMPPKMDLIMSAGGKMIKLWARDGRHVGNLSGHATTIWTADMSSDGKHAVSAAFNKTFLLWDVYNGEMKKKMQGHKDICFAVCIGPDDKMIASGSHDQRILLWDMESTQIIGELHGPSQEVLDILFSPDGSQLAAASKENTIRLYDVEGRKLTHILKGHRDEVRRLSFSPNGRYLLSSSTDQSCILWDARDGEKIHTFYEGEGEILDVAFHPDGKSFYTGSRNGGLKHLSLDPEVFVLKYYGTAFLDEVDAIPELKERQKGESKKDYQARLEHGKALRKEALERYYARYLSEHSPAPAQ